MALDTEIKATIVAWVDKASFRDWINFARDNWKKIDQELRKKLELDLVSFQVQLDQARQKLRLAKKEWDKEAIINAQLNVNRLTDWVTLAKAKLKNLASSWDATVSALQLKFNQLWAWIGNIFKKIAWYFSLMVIWQQVLNFFKDAVAKATQMQATTALLNSTLKATWWTVWLTAHELIKMWEELSKVNGIETDTIIATENVLLKFKNIKWDTLKWATQAVLDWATAMKWWATPNAEELAATATKLWKALEAPDKYTKILAKSWIVLSDTQNKQIANFMKLWEVWAADAIVLDAINSKVWGAATAQLDTYGWKVLQLNTKRTEFKELVWWLIIPILSSLLWIISSVIDWISNFVSIFSWKSKILQNNFWDIQKKIKENEVAQNDLTNARKTGWMSATEYGTRLHKLQDENKWLQTQSKNSVMSLSDVRSEINKISNSNISTSWKIKQLQALQKQAEDTADALDTVLIKLNNDLLKLKEAKTQESQPNWANVQWVWWMATMTDAMILRTNQLIDINKKSWDEQQKVISEASKELSKYGIWIWIDIWWDKGLWGAGKAVDKLKQDFSDAFDSIKDDIKTSDDAINKLQDEIDTLSWKLKWLNENIASRVADIDALLAKTWEEAVTAEERAKLEAEKAEAFKWLTAEQVTALQTLIDKQIEYNGMTDIGKLKQDFLNETWFTPEKAQIEIDTKKANLEAEQTYNKALNDAKIAIEADYTTKYWENIDKQIVKNNALKKSYDILADAAKKARDAMLLAQSSWWTTDIWQITWKAIWWPVSAWSPYIVWEKWPELFVPSNSWKIIPNNQMTNNININANVSNDIELDRLANALAKKIALSRKGIF